MQSIERLHHRIEKLGDLHTIVKTMKALSAVSIRQYEKGLLALNDYNYSVELGLYAAMQESEATPLVDAENSNARSAGTGIIVLGSDVGLCGQFNEDICRYTIEQTRHIGENQHRYLTIGARVFQNIEREKLHVEQHFSSPSSLESITETVREVLVTVNKWRQQGEVQEVLIFYNNYQAGSSYEPSTLKLFPIALDQIKTNITQWPSNNIPTYTLPKEQLLSALLRQYFFVTVFRTCLESLAAEHSSRVNAMQASEKNIDKKLTAVTTHYRRSRQESVTAELLDVMSGFKLASTDI